MDDLQITNVTADAPSSAPAIEIQDMTFDAARFIDTPVAEISDAVQEMEEVTSAPSMIDPSASLEASDPFIGIAF